MLRGSRGLTAIHGSTSAPLNTVLVGVPPAVQPGNGVVPDTATGSATGPVVELDGCAAFAAPPMPPTASTPMVTVVMVISLRMLRMVAHPFGLRALHSRSPTRKCGQGADRAGAGQIEPVIADRSRKKVMSGECEGCDQCLATCGHTALISPSVAAPDVAIAYAMASFS